MPLLNNPWKHPISTVEVCCNQGKGIKWPNNSFLFNYQTQCQKNRQYVANKMQIVCLRLSCEHLPLSDSKRTGMCWQISVNSPAPNFMKICSAVLQKRTLGFWKNHATPRLLRALPSCVACDNLMLYCTSLVSTMTSPSGLTFRTHVKLRSIRLRMRRHTTLQ